MNTIAQTVPSKDGGEVTDVEEPSFALVTTQRSSLSSGQNHRTVSGGDAVNLVVADEIPEEQEIEDDDDEDGDDEDDEYEYEDDDDAAFSGFLVDNPAITAVTVESAEPATIEEEEQPKPKWRQPSEEAVSMSLRAEKETTGGKRRLAQDLYRIMNQDTEEAGFSLKPSQEDSMDKWTIQLFQFDEDSKLAKDMKVLDVSNVELEMVFPDQYPFEPPFVRVTQPRFRRQTGFVMNGALCMELLTTDGWNPVNDIESVIVSIRSLLVVGDGRLEAACNLPDAKYKALLEAASKKLVEPSPTKKQKADDASDAGRQATSQGGSYSVSEAQAAYSHLSDYHHKKGWDTTGWWARKG